MAASVSEMSAAVPVNSSSKYPAIPKIKIKFEGYSPDGSERVKRPKIVRAEEKQKTSSAVTGYKGQCLTCHQCRQSVYSNKGTLELKLDVKSGKQRLKCSQCTRFWCERCLINRYGLVLESMDPSSWKCPFCKKNCNCSVCRKKEGKLATGIMTHIAKNAGYQSVSDFLDKDVGEMANMLREKSDSTTPPPKIKPRNPGGRPRVYDRPDLEAKASNKSPPIATPKKEQTAILVPAKIKVQPPKTAGNTLPEKPAGATPLKVSCVENRGMVSNGMSKFRVVCPLKWKHVNHTYYDIYMQDEGISASQVEQSCSAPDLVRKDNTVVIDLESSELTVPFQASPLPFGMPFPSSRSPTPMRPTRKRRNPSRYSSSEYELDLMETKSAHGDVSLLPPVWLKSLDGISLRESSSPDSSSYLESCNQNLNTSPKDLNVGYGMLADGSCDVIGVGHANLPGGGGAGGTEKVEKLQVVVATKQEQYELARRIILKAQKDVMRKEQRMQRKAELSSSSPKEPRLEDDSPAACQLASIPPLPSLPYFHLPLPSQLISSFLFVSEFLFTFQEQLGLKRRIAGEDLCSMVAGGRGLGEIYRKLLYLIVAESSNLWKEMKVSRQRDLEKVAKKYLQESGKNGFLPEVGGVEQCADQSLVILNHLCHHVLEMGSMDEFLEESRLKLDRLQREHKIKEKEKGQEVKEELLVLREKEGSEVTKNKRLQFMSQLEAMKKDNEMELYSSCLQLRNEPLGRDRHGRVYWNIPSLSAVVVECTPPGTEEEESAASVSNGCVSGSNGEENELATQNGGAKKESEEEEEEDMEVDGELKIDCGDSGNWLIITSNKLLEELSNCLHPRGRREKKLRESLLRLKGSLSTS